MNLLNPLKRMNFLFCISLSLEVLIFLYPSEICAQKSELEKSIERHRKGEIIVKAEPGAAVIVEQQEHEFWFSCAISDGIFNGRTSEADVKMYKGKFLENFNSAVTEDAVKWANMEPHKGKSELC